MTPPTPRRPLHDITVIDATRALAGPHAISGPTADQPRKAGTTIAVVLAGMSRAQTVRSVLLERPCAGSRGLDAVPLLAPGVGVHTLQEPRWMVANDAGRTWLYEKAG